ncbi:Glutathione S-transferase, N-terminal domain protein [Coleofasciculus chthonoplastes PCC 7420]|uniref:Glutathione S-transferase, N-terminal domain protein n=1 Tax=Coleofasciculus chthonoplastes PCC 7420 TaxID=118168 RepID=B4W0V2_9CYAN|nr:glutathione S-transferase family protein [Coleofasciculus chthonoplastes]EDX72143.1 Glutathione S-transferase, N-terminal domain protein [Coleofasciculus chthonoplastes PCC 7420]
MLKFYYNQISVNARRVWVTLLEKQIPFEPILVNLDGDHLSDDFTAINPLQRIPVVIDNGFRIVESLAILDYLEAKYPTPSLMPNEINAIATVRMVEMIAINELQPLMIPLTKQLVGLEVKPDKIDNARQRITTIIKFYENLLAGQSYFVNNQITLADIVAGTLVPSLPQFALSLDNYPSLKTWSQQLEQRESWQQTSVKPEMVAAAIPNMRAILEKR